MEIGIKKYGNVKMPVVFTWKMLNTVQNRLTNLYAWEPSLYNAQKKGDHLVTLSLRPNKNYRPDFFRKISPRTGNKLNAICFHGHLAWMTEIFTIKKYAHIKSTFANYKSAEDFFQGDKVQDTQERNIWKPDEHVSFSEACECSGEVQDFVWDRFHAEAGDGTSTI